MKLQLIDNWRDYKKMWSLKLNAAGTAVLGVIVVFPEQVVTAYTAMPDEVKALIPIQYLPYVSLGLYVAGMAARLIKQNELHKD